MLLYIHIPFCDSKCFYCSFNSYTTLFHLKEKYIQSLKLQLQYELEKIGQTTLESVFIGGGTPSTIAPKYYYEMFDILNPYITNDTEITIEANPNSATLQWLSQIYQIGINRISFGVQSFDDKKLKFLGRSHNSLDGINAINNSFEVGFTHINCDIIYDTSIDTKELINNDLAIIKSLPIDHISCYSLTIEEGTKFFTTPSVKLDNIELAHHIFTQLGNLGFTQYEISNFAKNTNSQSKHNKGYWKKMDYLGIGAGAVGTIENKRYYPNKNIQQYIDDPLKYESIEQLSIDDQKTETIFLGFRSIIGVELSLFNNLEIEKIKLLEKEKKVTIDQNRVYNNDFMLTDEIVLFITS